MAQDDKLMQKVNQKVQEYKGTIQTCHLCGYKGQYDKEVDVLMTFVNAPKASINFRCKDRTACKQRQAESREVK